MPNGVTHRRLTLALQCLTLPLIVVTDFESYAGLQAGIATTYYINPDLDITTNRLGAARYFGFETYRKLIPHRFGLSPRHWNHPGNALLFSHFPFVGTVIRTVLVLLLGVIPLLLTDTLYLIRPRFILFYYLGMALSDTLHIIADILYSGFRRTL